MERARATEVAKYGASGVLGVVWWLLNPPQGAIPLVLLSLAPLPVALVAMRWRHAHPVLLALSLAILHVPFGVLLPVADWAFISICAHRRWWATASVGIVFVAAMTWGAYRSNAINMQFNGEVVSEPSWALPVASLSFGILYVCALAAVGSYIGARRAEQRAWQEQLALAQRQTELAEGSARAEERNRIAREMHDVLAHKISLISMHAGALSYRDDLSAEEVKRAAGTIQEGSHQALSELRMILGELRQTEDGKVAPPQPTLAHVEALVAQQREAGAHITSTIEVVPGVPNAVSRHGYRVVQEALTNAAKHAPGAPVTLEVRGTASEGVRITVTNALGVRRTQAEGARLGLIGVDERVRSVGGRCDAGVKGKQFVVEVWMPWSQS